MLAEHIGGEPQVLEPDKCEAWGWFAWDDLPQPLFLPIRNLLRQGFRP
jgi:8-oxo-dGTP diphosphatase